MSALCLSLSAVCMEGKMQAQFLLCHLQYSKGGVVFLFGLVRGFLSPLETGLTSLLAQMARSRRVSPSLWPKSWARGGFSAQLAHGLIPQAP